MPCNVSPEEAEALGEGLSTLVSLDCSWPLHCSISRKEGCTTLHVAVDKEGAMMDGVPSFRGAPFLPNIGPLVLGSGSCAPPCGPFCRPGSTCAHRPPQLQAAAKREHFPGFELKAFVQEAAHLLCCPAWGKGQPPLPPLSQEVVDHCQQSPLCVYLVGGICHLHRHQ